MTITKAELEGFRDYVNSKTWKNAKTYEHFAPHEYIVNEPCDIKKNKYKCFGNCEACTAEREEFEKWVKFVRDNGERARVGKRTFLMFVDGGKQYWTFGEPLEEVICFNRAIYNDPRCKLKTFWIDRKPTPAKVDRQLKLGE